MDPDKPEAQPVTMDHKVVKAFFANSRVIWSQTDQKLFEELYTIMDDFQTPAGFAKWTPVLQEDDKRCFYVNDESTPYGTIMTDLVCNATITETIACFDNHEICMDVLPQCIKLNYVYRRGEANALVYM